MFEKLLFVLGLGIVTTITIYMLIDVLSKKSEKIRPVLNKGIFKSYKVNGLAVLVFVGVLWWFKNPVPALLAAIIVVYMPYQIVYIRQRRLKQQVIEQLALAVTLFNNTLVVTKNIPRSIDVVGKRISDPVGGFFQKTYSELVFGVPLEKAVDNLAGRLGISYGYIFARLLKTAQNQGDIIAPLFTDLSNKITVAQEMANFETTETSAIRYTNIVLLILPVPMFLVLSAQFEEMTIFATSTAGRIIFTIWLLAVIVWMLMDRMVVDS